MTLKPRLQSLSCVWGALALLALLLFPFAPAQAKYASFVMDADSGEVLHEINADTRNYPASLTKMMTLYMLFDALDRGQLRENDRLKVSRRAASRPASRLGLKRGQTITVRDAILALVTKSANDVAVVVAEYLGRGKERTFARLMTKKAHAIGMKSTNFRNASGLYSRAQLSTARDMATLAMRLYKDYPHYYHFFATAKFDYQGKTYKNHNKLLKTYDGVDGIKTGYIRASGFNLVASAKRDGRRLIGVVFGGRNAKVRNAHMSRLLDKGFEKMGVLVAQATPPKDRVQAKSKTKTKALGRYGIQVGAFAKYSPAVAAAHKALANAPRYLADGIVRVAPLSRKRKNPLYRARVVGISKRQAYRACRIIKKTKSAGCMTFKLKKPVQVAEAG